LRKLELQSINVITNALNIATLLADVPFVRLIMPGGILRPESNSLSGHMAEAALANLQADRLFLGADGLDPERGVMTPHLPEAQLNAQDDRHLRPGHRRGRLLETDAQEHLADRAGRAAAHADHRQCGRS
jgi:hypothetical protein